MLKLKRAYEPAERGDGFRVFVERLWPRGVTKEKAALALWLKEIAPSPELHQWYRHDPAKWEEFRRRYLGELKKHPDALQLIRDQARQGDVTLVYGSRDTEHSGARVLKEYLEGAGHTRRTPPARRETKAHSAPR